MSRHVEIQGARRLEHGGEGRQRVQSKTHGVSDHQNNFTGATASQATTWKKTDEERERERERGKQLPPAVE